MTEINAQLLECYIEETNEHLSVIDEILHNSGDIITIEDVKPIYRGVHSIKGAGAYFGFKEIIQFTHELEELLHLVIAEGLTDTGLKPLIVESIDHLKDLFQNLDDLGGNLNLELLERVVQFAKLDHSDTILSTSESTSDSLPDMSPVMELIQEGHKQGFTSYWFNLSNSSLGDEDRLQIDSIGAMHALDYLGEGQYLIISALEEELISLATQVEPESIQRIDPEKLLASDQGEQNESSVNTAEEQQQSTHLDTVRIKSTQLDRLVNLVGELNLSRRSVEQMVSQHDTRAEGLTGGLRKISQNVGMLQESILDMRLQPFEQLITSFRRLIRDLGRQFQVDVKYVYETHDAKVDKSILESLVDPLFEILYACIKAGSKNSQGIEISIQAVQKSQFVHADITVSGSAFQAGEFLPHFNPGQSTHFVSYINSYLHNIGGTFQYLSDHEKTLEFELMIPVTVSILSCLHLACEGRPVLIPQPDVTELLDLAHATKGKLISEIEGRQVLKYRGKLIPMLDLAHYMGDANSNTSEGNLIITQRSGECVCLIASEVLGIEEIVTKNVPVFFPRPGIFSGFSLLGEGDIVPVLDLREIYRNTEVISNIAEETKADNDIEQDRFNPDIMIVESVGGGHYSLPISQISRVIQTQSTNFHQKGEKSLYHYSGDLIQLEPLEAYFQTDQCISHSDFVDEEQETYLVLLEGRLKDLGLPIRRVVQSGQIAVERLESTQDSKGVTSQYMFQGNLVLELDSELLFEQAIFSSLDNNSSSTGSNP